MARWNSWLPPTTLLKVGHLPPWWLLLPGAVYVSHQLLAFTSHVSNKHACLCHRPWPRLKSCLFGKQEHALSHDWCCELFFFIAKTQQLSHLPIFVVFPIKQKWFHIIYLFLQGWAVVRCSYTNTSTKSASQILLEISVWSLVSLLCNLLSFYSLYLQILENISVFAFISWICICSFKKTLLSNNIA